MWRRHVENSAVTLFNLGRNNLVPSTHAIKTLIRNFDENGSAMKKPPGHVWLARTQDNTQATQIGKLVAIQGVFTVA